MIRFVKIALLLLCAVLPARAQQLPNAGSQVPNGVCLQTGGPDCPQIGGPQTVAGTPAWVLPGATVDLNFAGGAYFGCSVSSCLTVTRAQTVTSYATTSAGVLVPFAANTPRITDLGLLVEEARTNLVLQSNALANASWNQSQVASLTQNVVGVDNAISAWTMNATGGAQCGIFQFITSAAGSTFSFYAAAGTSPWVYLLIGQNTGATGTVGTWFNVSTGAIGLQNVVVSGSPTITLAATISPLLSNGFYRISVTSAVQQSQSIQVGVSNANGAILVSAGKTAAFEFGQYELGSFPTSYIPTAAAAVARNSDNVQAAGALLATLGGSAWSFAIRTATSPNPAANLPRLISAAGSNPAFFSSTTNVASFNGTVTLNAILGSGAVNSNPVNVASGANASGRSLVANNGTVVSDANVFAPLTSPYIGSAAGTSAFLDAPISRLTVWNSRLPDATLKAMTQ